MNATRYVIGCYRLNGRDFEIFPRMVETEATAQAEATDAKERCRDITPFVVRVDIPLPPAPADTPAPAVGRVSLGDGLPDLFDDAPPAHQGVDAIRGRGSR